MESKTFLNDKKINGELYSYLQEISIPRPNGEGVMETVVDKSKMPA